MESIGIILLLLIFVFVVILIIALIYFWLKTEKEFKNDGKRESIDKIKDNKNKDKTRDVSKQMIKESDVNKIPDSKPKVEPSVTDKDFDRIPVSQIDENKDEKTWSTITCTGSREIRSPQSAPANELLESFGDYSPTNFRSPESDAIETDANQTEPNQLTDSKAVPEKKKSTEDLKKSNENKAQPPEESQTKPEDITLEMSDNKPEKLTLSDEN